MVFFHCGHRAICHVVLHILDGTPSVGPTMELSFVRDIVGVAISFLAQVHCPISKIWVLDLRCCLLEVSDVDLLLVTDCGAARVRRCRIRSASRGMTGNTLTGSAWASPQPSSPRTPAARRSAVPPLPSSPRNPRAERGEISPCIRVPGPGSSTGTSCVISIACKQTRATTNLLGRKTADVLFYVMDDLAQLRWQRCSAA